MTSSKKGGLLTNRARQFFSDIFLEKQQRNLSVIGKFIELCGNHPIRPLTQKVASSYGFPGRILILLSVGINLPCRVSFWL